MKFIITIFLVFVMALAGCSQHSQPKEGKATIIIKTIGNSTVEEQTLVGRSVAEALRDNHGITLTYGQFLKCIDSICSNREFSWALYVNNQKINTGVETYILKDNDVIEVVYE